MAFQSNYATAIWEDLYNVYIPDFLTMNRDYIRTFGVPSSGNREVDKMMSSNMTFVKIPIIKILEYFDNGIDVQIPSRADMIAMHKCIERYLGEWYNHLKFDINVDRVKHKELLLGLERLSKIIYDKANPREVMDNLIVGKGFGLKSHMDVLKKDDRVFNKPDYKGLSTLLKPSLNNRY